MNNQHQGALIYAICGFAIFITCSIGIIGIPLLGTHIYIMLGPEYSSAIGFTAGISTFFCICCAIGGIIMLASSFGAAIQYLQEGLDDDG